MGSLLLKFTSNISIHPPLAGRDPGCTRSVAYFRYFNPPAPCGAGHDRLLEMSLSRYISIHPPLAGRDATVFRSSFSSSNFNPPAPCGAGPPCLPHRSGSSNFNPPAPCGAGLRRSASRSRRRPFQSTRPLRGGTFRASRSAYFQVISIHPPLAGRDSPGRKSSRHRQHFNPPAPCGAGPVNVGIWWGKSGFQSTRPLRGGTAILHKKTVQNIAYCTKSAFTLAVLSGFLALMRPFFLPNVHKFRCEPSEESLLAPRSHAYTIRTPSG